MDTFEINPDSRWEFIADTVMGGVSTGELQFLEDRGDSFARLSGRVSTENRGGFIQFRHILSASPPEDAKGVRLIVRGNEQVYYIHLRTSGTVLPWQYYQASFVTTHDWVEVYIPFADFKRSGGLLRQALQPKSLTSIGVVAFGRDHDAEVDVREIGFSAVH